MTGIMLGMQTSLAIFDIDGTLTQTSGVDGECYVKALGDCFGFEQIDTNWSNYRHTTDSAILSEIFEQRLGRPPDPQERELAMNRLVTLLEAHWREEPDAFQAVPGAASALQSLDESPRWCTALATGACRPSARFKLAKAGLNIEQRPLASSEDGPSREQIVRTALDQSRVATGALYQRIVSVGDGLWDVRTAARLSLPFVGIGSGAQALALTQAGASHVLADYSDLDDFLTALEAARPPPEQ